MADKKKSGISVMPNFVDGEQPTAYKFNTIGAQVTRSSYNLEVAVGDIWEESYPYSTVSNTRLSLDNISNSNLNTFTDSSSIGRRLDINSLGRLIGPASNLNPLVLNFDDNGPLVKTITNEAVPKGVCEFTLRYLPLDVSTVVFSGGTSGLTQRVPAKALLNNAGDFFIDSSTGQVFTVSVIQGNYKVAYQTKPGSWNGGSSYLGGSFNTIPDPNQVNSNTADQLVLTLQNDGKYMVVLPVARSQQLNNSLYASALNTTDVNYGVQLTLPIAITLACGGSKNSIMGTEGIAGTVIPEGMIYLRNETTEKVYDDAIYYYNSRTSLKIKTVEELDTTQKYSLITVGVNITSSIQDLNKKFLNHSHSREFGEKLVSINDIGDIFRNPSPYTGNYVPSGVPTNFMPQYLHRDGSRGNDTGPNDDNAMRGDLVIGRRDDVNGNTISTAGLHTGEGTSHVLAFSRRGNDTSRIFQTEGSVVQQLNIFNTNSNKQANMVLYTNNTLTLNGLENVIINQTIANGMSNKIDINAAGMVDIDAGTGITLTSDTNYITNTAPIFIISSANGVNGYAQASDGIGLGNYSGVRSYWDSNFNTSSASGVWYVPQLKTVSYRKTGFKLYAYGYNDLTNSVTLQTTQGSGIDYVRGKIDLPEMLTHGPNVQKVNNANITSPAIILPHMISCVVRRSNSALNAASWWQLGQTAYVNDKSDFEMRDKVVGDTPKAHIYGVLKGSAYNSGELEYHIMADADEGSDGGTDAPNDFSRHYIVEDSAGAYILVDVILTIWYMQGEYP